MSGWRREEEDKRFAVGCPHGPISQSVFMKMAIKSTAADEVMMVA
jgi:hypothetical protein